MRVHPVLPVLSALLIATPGVASAQSFDAAAAIEGFLTDTALLGADSATVGNVTTDGDTVTATDVSMTWSVSFEAEGDEVTLNASASIPSMTVTGLAPTADGHRADAIQLPSLKAQMQLDGAPDEFSYSFDITDYTFDNASWSTVPQIVANPAAPISRFGPLLDWSISQSYDRVGIGSLSAVINTDGDVQNVSYGATSFGPVRDGTVANLEYPAFSATQSLPDGRGVSRPVTFNYGAITARNIDAKPLVQLFTGTGDATGPVNVTESIDMAGFSITGADDMTMSMGPMEMQGFTIDPTRGPLLQRFDSIIIAALSGREPTPQEVIPLILDVYAAYGIGRYAFSDISFAGEGVSGSLAEFAIDGFNANGLERFGITGFDMSTPDGTGSLGSFAITGITFPEREAAMNATMASMLGAPFSLDMLAAFPTVGGLSIEGLNVDSEDASSGGPLALGRFAVELGGYISAFPTQLSIALEGLNMPAELLDDPQATAIVSALGANPIQADGAVNLAWSEATGDVTLTKDVSVRSVGALTARAALAGIPRFIFENPARAQEALATAAIGGVEVKFNDEGVTPFLLGMMAQQSGVDANQLAAGLAQQVAFQVSALTGDQNLGQTLSNTLTTYLGDPQSLTIAADPGAPVPVAQILGAAMTAPAQIFSILNLTVVANQ
ncbi:MAG: hypothetical protein AAF318_08130 [Pseudomonadota bacterium]